MKLPGALEGFALADTHLASALIEAMLDAVWLVDAASLRIVAANNPAGEMLGCPAAALCGREVAELCATPEDLCFWREAGAGLSDAIESETWVRRFDGGTVPVTRRVTRLDLVSGQSMYVAVLHDRSAQRRTEAELEERVAELSATLESTADGLLVTDLAGNIRSFNQAFASLWCVPDTLLRRRDDDALFAFMRRSVIDPAGYMRRLAALEDGDLREAVDCVALASGRMLQRVSLPQTSRAGCIGRVYSFRDITARLEAIHRLDTLSHSDLLTGLPTRSVLAERVKFSIALAQRDGTPFALLFANLDRFKHINDTLGHEFGDQVLADVADRLKGCLRQIDTVARLGGDEFVMLVHQADAAGAETAARRVLDALQQPFHHGELSFTVTCSIGIALHRAHGESLEQLLRHADAAMHEVKEAGRAAYRFHQANERGAVENRGRLELDSAMREALACGRFRLHYQPQVDLATGKVLGAEALIRWHDPVLGNVPPAEFIPVAEQSGFIVAIGDWVLRQALQQAAAWHAQGRGLVVSVNVSAVQ
ncbi:partial putative signaling protein, partial [Burkholderiaceae bacterium]